MIEADIPPVWLTNREMLYLPEVCHSVLASVAGGNEDSNCIKSGLNGQFSVASLVSLLASYMGCSPTVV